MKLTAVGKVVALIMVVGAALGGWQLWQRYGGSLAPEAPVIGSVVPGSVTLPEGPQSGPTILPANVVLPSSQPAGGGREIRMLGYAWNAQMGLMFANGGPQTTNDSLMSKRGVNLKFQRQDDNGKLQESLVAFATELSQGNAQPGKGAHYVMIMGDGSATFLKGLNDTLKKIGPEYRAKIVGSCGYSRGEDKFMGPQEWKDNPSASRGGLVAGVLRDGDWNIAQKWLGDNGLRTNPDEKTWDPDVLNWVGASDYLDACQKYIGGYSEERAVVRNGKRTGEKKRVSVNGVVTWTPGDVQVAEQKGGLVSVVSTREYSSQMPNVIIGIDKWMRANRETVEGMLQAICEGGDAVKSSPEALRRAAAVSNACYNESGTNAAYWEKYYKGVRQKDKQGLDVELGGSSANNLADNLLTFGLVTGSSNLFAATYTVFGNMVVQQYPDLVPSIDPVEQILDTSYLKGLAQKVGSTQVAVEKVKPVYVKSTGRKKVLSQKVWRIAFNSGQASFTAPSYKVLDELKSQLLVASGTTVEVQGHTDSQGNPSANMQLSEERAFAVKQWLQKQSSINFPDERVSVRAYGQSAPVAPNSTPQGRAKNRRVVIKMLTNS